MGDGLCAIATVPNKRARSAAARTPDRTEHSEYLAHLLHDPSAAQKILSQEYIGAHSVADNQSAVLVLAPSKSAMYLARSKPRQLMAPRVSVHPFVMRLCDRSDWGARADDPTPRRSGNRAKTSAAFAIIE